MQKLYKMLIIPRSELFQKKTKQSCLQNQAYFVTEYSSLANPINRSDPVLSEVFFASPKISFKRAPTLRDRLVSSHLPAIKQQTTGLNRQLKGTYKCGSCNHCSSIKECEEFCNFKTDKRDIVKAFINSNTTFVVHRLSCKCGCFYVGRTKRCN